MGNCLVTKPYVVHPAFDPSVDVVAHEGYRVKVRMTAAEFKELAERTATEGGMVLVGDGAAGEQLLGRAVIDGCKQGRWQAVCFGAAVEAKDEEVGRRIGADAGNSTSALPSIPEAD